MSAYRDLHARFAGSNAQVLGVSNDDLATLKKFAESLKLPFSLGSDADGKVARAYGVAVERDGKVDHVERVTFVINRAGKIDKVIEGKDALDPTPALAACTVNESH